MVAFFTIFYPGAMTWDSMEQLRQARLSEYGDWQPPAMAFVWHQLLVINDGPGVMLFFHMSMLYGASLFLYLWAVRNSYRWSAIFLFIPFLPWIVNFEFVIWKDVGLAFSWLFAVSIAIFYSDRERFPLIAAGTICILFFYGFLIRANSIAGAVFLLPFLASCIFKKNSIRFFLLSAFFSVVFFVILPKAVDSMLSAEVTHPTSYVMVDDLVALKLRNPEMPSSILLPEDMLNLETCEVLRQRKVGAPFCLKEKFVDIRENHYSQLKSEWYSAVTGNIIEYIGYRLSAFVTLIRSPTKNAYYASEFRMVNDPYKFDSDKQLHSSKIGAKGIVNYVHQTQETFPELFKPYFWLLISLFTAVALKRAGRHSKVPYWMLPLSGFTYTMGYIPATPEGDFRYVYWLCLIVTASMMIWAGLKFNRNEIESREATLEADPSDNFKKHKC